MKCFLNPDRQQKLTEMLTTLGQKPEQIQQYIDGLPDDIEHVDIEMLTHVQCVIYCRAIDEPMQSLVGLAILVNIMMEAKSRGLEETDFPKSYQAIQDNLIELGLRPPPSENLQ